MPKHVILDANVLLYDPQAFFAFQDCNVIIPIEVIEKIDEFKREMTELGRNSRTVAILLDNLRKRGKLGAGIDLGNGSALRIVSETGHHSEESILHVGKVVERRILELALTLQKEAGEAGVVVVTKDVNLRLKSDALGVQAEDYAADRFPDPDEVTGWRSIVVRRQSILDVRKGLPVDVDGEVGLPNEFALLQENEAGRNRVCARFPQRGSRLVPIYPVERGAAGIHPLNVEQTFALSALLDDKIEMVTLTGKAGTGKTLLALAAGLEKVFGEDRYNRVLVFRPTMPVGRDIGYLPGTVEEKMRPWMQPVYDALELIREEDKHGSERILPPDVMECPEISIEPLTFIRGRSIPRQYIIIDEAQNLTPLEVKTVITRVGKESKIVLTGDPHQIDNPYVEALSNGLTYLVDRFKESDIAAHVGLAKGERSPLAETAANLL